jgi:DNA (cytosine-5)-methyltransferase 1
MIKCVDFFCGCGGTSAGLRRAGIRVVVGIDNDPDAATTFRSNFPEASLLQEDVRALTTTQLERHISRDENDTWLFSACAPCQPFTQHRQSGAREDARGRLLAEFLRFVEHFLPELLFVENVPGLASKGRESGPFNEMLDALERQRYWTAYGEFNCWDFGVPQKRRRFALVGSRLGPIEFPMKTHGPGTSNPRYSTVREWISDLPTIDAGQQYKDVPNHRAASLSALNLQRIRATPAGGGRKDWPKSLELECHSGDFEGYSDVYGRMRWDAPASALTTRCISYSNGRFGHPSQDRAISAREAACLQTFPIGFGFVGSLNSVARQIGNAVPVLVSQNFGENFVTHVKTYADE